jgi:hypothetical protein
MPKRSSSAAAAAATTNNGAASASKKSKLIDGESTTKQRWRWGVMGSGKIATDFVSVLQRLPCDLQAVGARSLANAEAFAKKFGIKNAYGSYLQVAEDPHVDV